MDGHDEPIESLCMGLDLEQPRQYGLCHDQKGLCILCGVVSDRFIAQIDTRALSLVEDQIV